MAIDPKVISSSNKKLSRAGIYFPKLAIYSMGGLSVLVIVGLMKAVLPAIGMAFLLAFIWSQAKTTRRY